MVRFRIDTPGLEKAVLTYKPKVVANLRTMRGRLSPKNVKRFYGVSLVKRAIQDDLEPKAPFTIEMIKDSSGPKISSPEHILVVSGRLAQKAFKLSYSTEGFNISVPDPKFQKHIRGFEVTEPVSKGATAPPRPNTPNTPCLLYTSPSPRDS